MTASGDRPVVIVRHRNGGKSIGFLLQNDDRLGVKSASHIDPEGIPTRIVTVAPKRISSIKHVHE